jgi:hypothetical protein
MATFREITNQAVGFKHLGPGAMTGVFKQQPAQILTTKKYKADGKSIVGACGARVALQAHTSASAVIMAAGECGLSGVMCAECLELDSEEMPGLHGQG